jgi:hypothetical protein
MFELLTQVSIRPAFSAALLFQKLKEFTFVVYPCIIIY